MVEEEEAEEKKFASMKRQGGWVARGTDKVRHKMRDGAKLADSTVLYRVACLGCGDHLQSGLRVDAQGQL